MSRIESGSAVYVVHECSKVVLGYVVGLGSHLNYTVVRYRLSGRIYTVEVQDLEVFRYRFQAARQLLSALYSQDRVMTKSLVAIQESITQMKVQHRATKRALSALRNKIRKMHVTATRGN